MARFGKIGIGAGKIFDADKLSPDVKAAIGQGMADAWADSGVNRLRILTPSGVEC